MTAELPLIAIDELRPTHLAKHPIWVLCGLPVQEIGDGLHDHVFEQGEYARYHPLPAPLPLDCSHRGELIVRARFTLADGEQLDGAVGVTQHGRRPVTRNPMLKLNKQRFLQLEPWPQRQETQLDEARAQLYGTLGKTPAQLFPLRYSVEPGLLTESLAGNAAGFRVWTGAHVRETP